MVEVQLVCGLLYMEEFQESKVPGRRLGLGEWMIREQPPQRVQDKGGGRRSLLEILIAIVRLLRASTG
jgi:hypothetical protein